MYSRDTGRDNSRGGGHVSAARPEPPLSLAPNDFTKAPERLLPGRPSGPNNGSKGPVALLSARLTRSACDAPAASSTSILHAATRVRPGCARSGRVPATVRPKPLRGRWRERSGQSQRLWAHLCRAASALSAWMCALRLPAGGRGRGSASRDSAGAPAAALSCAAASPLGAQHTVSASC